MKKFLFIISATLFMIACTGVKKDKKVDEESRIEIQDDGLASYQFKINGLQDSIISDSIWRIIFQVEGVQQVVLSKVDSIVVFKVNPELVSNELLEQEIVSRGGELLN